MPPSQSAMVTLPAALLEKFVESADEASRASVAQAAVDARIADGLRVVHQDLQGLGQQAGDVAKVLQEVQPLLRELHARYTSEYQHAIQVAEEAGHTRGHTQGLEEGRKLGRSEVKEPLGDARAQAHRKGLLSAGAYGLKEALSSGDSWRLFFYVLSALLGAGAGFTVSPSDWGASASDPPVPVTPSTASEDSPHD